MADKQSISSSDKDFASYEVRIHGVLISNVVTADVARGEVWVHDGETTDKPKELKTGTVTIQAVAAPKSTKASTGRKSASAQSTSGA